MTEESTPEPSTTPADTPQSQRITLEQLGNFADAAVKLVAVVAGLSAVLGWFIHGVWAEKTGLQINQAWNFQYIVIGFIPMYVAALFAFHVYIWWRFFLSTLKVMYNDTDTLEMKLKKMENVFANNAGPISVFFFISSIMLAVAIKFLDPSYANSSIPDFILELPIEKMVKDPQSSAYVFSVWLLIPTFYSWVITLGAMWLIYVNVRPTPRQTRLAYLLVVTIFGAAFYLPLRDFQLTDYYSTLPKQLGGAKASRVEFILEGGPEEFYPAGQQKDSERTLPLDLVYSTSDYYVVKLPNSSTTYQISTDQVKTIVTRFEKKTTDPKLPVSKP